MRFVLVNLDSPNQIELNNADLHNLAWALRYAHEAAGGIDTEYEKLRLRLVDAFAADLS